MSLDPTTLLTAESGPTADESAAERDAVPVERAIQFGVEMGQGQRALLLARIERLRRWIKTRVAYTAHEGVFEWEAHAEAVAALEPGDLE